MALMMPSEPRAGAAPRGFALFALGFRPFYLFAALYAALSVPLWGLQYAGYLPGAGMLWHSHEMLFGYAFAVIAGFLLTAVRVWSGRETPNGVPLGILAAIWVIARIAAPFSLPVAAALDALFAIGVAWGIGQPLIASGNLRNWFFIPLVLALGAASTAFLAWPQVSLAIGLDVVLFVMAVMGGRVIPAFTNNAIPDARARRNPQLEYASLAAILLLLFLDLVQWGTAASVVALVAAVLHAARLALWSPWKTLVRPIVWILHVSYAWIAVHLLLRGLGGFGVVAPMLATHALTVGAIGGLTLGMMTRTARGHTARPLKVGGAELGAYVLVHLAAAVRVLLPLVIPSAYVAFVVVSSVLWFAAFALYVIVYLPILTRPRLDGKPG